MAGRIEAPELLVGYLARIGRGRLLSPQEGYLSQGGHVRRPESRRKLVERNLRRLSVWPRGTGGWASLRGPHPGGQHRPDEGFEKFDHDRGFRFSTYATWWIRQAVQRPVTTREDHPGLRAHDERIRKASAPPTSSQPRSGREPTDEEVAERLGWTID